MSNSINTGATLTIDLGSLRQNYLNLSNQLKSSELASVVKADAYGLGVKEIASTLLAAGCKTFFVATLDEGIELRQILPTTKIYVLHGVLADTAKLFVSNNLIPVLNSLEQIEEWRSHKHHVAGLHVDTGMGRLGLTPKEYLNTDRLKNYNIDLIISHLACAEQNEHPKNKDQLDLFKLLLNTRSARHVSLAASSGIFLGPNYHFNLCRAGASILGINPTFNLPNPMEQVVSLRAEIIQIRSVDTPQTVGYGASYQVTKPARIATLAVGYADGYMRTLGNKGVTYIGEYEVPTVGRISMDLTTVDVTNIPDNLLSVGTQVDLIGPNNSIDQIAKQAGTIGYEILTALGKRFERRYVLTEK
jgi:alanine racemase